MLGTAIPAQLPPARGNIIAFAFADLLRGRHDLGEVVEVASPVPVADGEEELLLGGEVLVDGTFRIPRRVRDVIESRWRETLLGEDVLSGVEEQRARAL